MKKARWDIVALIVLLLIYAGLLLSRYAPAISGPDDNGYFAQGSLLAQSGRTWFTPGSDAQYIGMHWLLTDDGKYISRYPPGLAVLIGVVYAIGGWKAATLVNPALSVAALIGVFSLARRIGLDGAWSIACVVILAVNPVFVQHALAGDSHMAVTCLLAWGLYWLVRWSQDKQLWQLFVAGLVLGCIPTIRYPDSVVAIGIVIFIFWQVRRVPRFGLHMLAGMAGAAIPILPLLIRNQLVLGAFWRTGYALTNEQTGFGFEYFRAHALDYIQQLNSTGLGLAFALGIVGLVAMICASKSRGVGVLLAMTTLSMLLLYMAYYWAGMTMRFMLPTFPAFALAGVWAMKELTAGAPRKARLAVPVVVVLTQLLWGLPSTTAQANRLRGSHAALAAVTESLDATAPQGGVIIADTQLAQQLDFVRHWKVADASLVSRRGGGPGVGPGAPRDRPDGSRSDADEPSPMQSEKRELRQKLYPGSTEERERKFADDVRAWADGENIYLVGGESDVKRMLGDAVPADEIVILERIKLPQPPREPASGFAGRPNAGGPGFGRPGFGGAFRPRGRGGFDGGFAGPTAGPPGAGPGGGAPQGGPGGMGFPGDLKEVVIAQWKPST